MFHLTDEQAQEIKDWRKTHKCKLRTDSHGVEGEIYVGAIGGAIQYCFTPTGLGTLVTVKCACGESHDVSDTEDW